MRHHDYLNIDDKSIRYKFHVISVLQKNKQKTILLLQNGCHKIFPNLILSNVHFKLI